MKKKKASIVKVIRQALTNYITDYTKSQKGYEAAFAIWKGRKLDSLAYQQKLRDEWGK